MIRFFGAATSFRSDQVFGVHETESTRERWVEIADCNWPVTFGNE